MTYADAWHDSFLCDWYTRCCVDLHVMVWECESVRGNEWRIHMCDVIQSYVTCMRVWEGLSHSHTSHSHTSHMRGSLTLCVIHSSPPSHTVTYECASHTLIQVTYEWIISHILNSTHIQRDIHVSQCARGVTYASRINSCHTYELRTHMCDMTIWMSHARVPLKNGEIALWANTGWLQSQLTGHLDARDVKLTFHSVTHIALWLMSYSRRASARDVKLTFNCVAHIAL